MKEQSNIKYVYFFGGHPNQRKIAKHMNAEFDEISNLDDNIKIFGKTIPTQFIFSIFSCFFKAIFTKKNNGQIYFCEGISTVLYPAFMRLLKKEKSIVISRINAGAFNEENRRRLIKKYHAFLHKHLDGVIGITPMIAEDGKKLITCPIKTAPFTPWRLPEYFEGFTTELKERNFLFVGEYRNHKGIDILAKTLKILKKKLNFEFKAYLVGGKIEKNLKSLNLLDSSFVTPGHSDPRLYYKKCTFYIHTARYEPGGTAVAEATAAGLIPFVTHKVGAKSIVENVNPDLVISSLDPETIAEHISKFIKKTRAKELKQISNKFKKYAQNNNIDFCVKEYSKIFNKLVNNVKPR